MPSTAMPLSRFKVIDLCRARAGPTCVRQLADWGADTIKIEMPPGGIGVDSEEQRLGFDFFNIHRNKRSLTLNLKSEKGKEILFKLVKDADVVVENFRPDVKHRLGIDYEACKKINPRIIYGSISGFGQEGPYSSRAGLDQIAQDLGSIMSVTGLPGQGPVRVGIPICDLTAGHMLTQAILLALIEREASGEGQWVHTSLTEGMIQMMDLQAARYLKDGEVPVQQGNNHPTGVPTGVFKTSDGLINIQAATPHLFRRLCKGLGVPDMADKPEYKEIKGRQQHRDQCNADIEAITKTKTMKHWIELFAEEGVPCGPIYSMDQTFADPQVKTLNMDPTVEHPKLGKVHLVGQAAKLTRTPQKMRMPTPDLGQHTDEILNDLGYSKTDIDSFRQQGDI